MTKLKERAVEMIREIPEYKMDDLLDFMVVLINGNNIRLSHITDSKPNVSSEAFEAWENLKKFKGIIDRDINVKKELADARDEKYAYIG